jgi:peroxiredoxin (alkyl hydroperoxide reductase subunit C)
MLSDDQFHLSNNFQVLREGEGRADRATFIVDPNGVIQAMEVTSEGIGRDASDLLRKVKAAQYVHDNPDEVCPAKWKEGEDTLTPSLDLSGKI